MSPLPGRLLLHHLLTLSARAEHIMRTRPFYNLPVNSPTRHILESVSIRNQSPSRFFENIGKYEGILGVGPLPILECIGFSLASP